VFAVVNATMQDFVGCSVDLSSISINYGNGKKLVNITGNSLFPNVITFPLSFKINM
jgi:hypothetical protein